MHVFHLWKVYICSAKFSPEMLDFPVRAYSITFENEKLSLHHLCTHRHVLQAKMVILTQWGIVFSANPYEFANAM